MKATEFSGYFEESLYEMSNFYSHNTGLPDGIIMWVRTEPNGLPHTKYRIEIKHPQKGSAVFALWGDEPKQVAGSWQVGGKDLKAIKILVGKTHNEIRDLIDEKIDSVDLGIVFRDTF